MQNWLKKQQQQTTIISKVFALEIKFACHW